MSCNSNCFLKSLKITINRQLQRYRQVWRQTDSYTHQSRDTLVWGIYCCIMNFSKFQLLKIPLFCSSAHDSEIWTELGEVCLSLFYMAPAGVDHWVLEKEIPQRPLTQHLLSVDRKPSHGCWPRASALLQVAFPCGQIGFSRRVQTPSITTDFPHSLSTKERLLTLREFPPQTWQSITFTVSCYSEHVTRVGQIQSERTMQGMNTGNYGSLGGPENTNSHEQTCFTF